MTSRGRLPFGLRAGIAVTLIAGFYALVFAVLVGLGFGFGFLLGSGGWATFGAFVLFAMLIAVAVGFGRGIQPWAMTFDGARLDENGQPRLWALVRDLAERVGTRAPDEIWLVPEVNAGVMEHTKLLGLRGGRRYLVLGVPVLMAFTVEQLCAVLAHELGHYSHAHTRMSEVNYRGRTAMLAVYVKLKRINPIRWLFAGYARLYFLVEAAVSRQQELEADRAAGRIAGRSAAQAALVEVRTLAAAWDLYADRYVTPGLSYGIAPGRVFAGFLEFLRAREDELAELREHLGRETGTRWDSHPPAHVRLAALADAPEVGVYSDARPAWQLMAEPESFVEKAERGTFDFGDRRLLDWPGYIAESVRIDAEQHADAMYRALSRVTGRTPESLDTLLTACEQGEFDDLWRRMEQPHDPDFGIGMAVLAAAFRCGALRIEHRFDGVPRLLLADGAELVDALLSPLREGDDLAAAAAEVRAKLRAYGIDLALATTRQLRHDGAHTETIGAMPYVTLNGEWKDVVVAADGLVFMPGPEKRIQDLGKKRLTELLETTEPPDLIADPRNLWVPYEEMAAATVRRELPLQAEVWLHNGTTYELKEAMYGDPVGNAREVLHRFLSALPEGDRSR